MGRDLFISSSPSLVSLSRVRCRASSTSPRVKAGSMSSMLRLMPYSSEYCTLTRTSTVMPASSLRPVP